MILPPTLSFSLSLSQTHTDIRIGVHQGQIQPCISPMGTDNSVNIDISLSAAQNTSFFHFHSSCSMLSYIMSLLFPLLYKEHICKKKKRGYNLCCELFNSATNEIQKKCTNVFHRWLVMVVHCSEQTDDPMRRSHKP